VTASSTTSEAAVVCEDVVVAYRTSSVRTSTLKEFILNQLAGRNKWTMNHALNGVNLTAKKGECIALIGHNGCGKSTLLKVLAGILKPTGGKSVAHGRVAPLIELGAGFDPELTGRENVYLSCSLMGLTRGEINARLNDIREFAELGEYFDAPVKTYSSGMYMRLGFSCTTAIDADILLIDEILAVGDENFQKKCMKRMNEIRATGVTIVLVSHDMNVVRTMADRALVLDHGNTVFEGPAKNAVNFYLKMMEDERLAKLSEAERRETLRRQRLHEDAALAKEKVGGLARILDAEVAGELDSKGALVAGRPWRILLSVEISSPFTHPPVFGFAVHSHQGVRVFGGNSKIYPPTGDFEARATKPGRYRLTYAFEPVPLASGDYVLVAAIHDHMLEKTIDLRTDACRFNVVEALDPTNFDHDLISPRVLGVKVAFDALS
jgi:ABC-type polysaccharide/polyol phosphate transport system ATPase subunit